MIKQISFILIILLSFIGYSQKDPIKLKSSSDSGSMISNRLRTNSRIDSLSQKEEFQVELSEKTTYKNYQIIAHTKDTTYVDTTLVMKKDYIFNFRRKDNFELLAFHNQGQTFTNLGFDFTSVSLYPQLGARAKHFSFYEVEDINYYHVATPTSELMYRGGLEQGQVLNTLITLNVAKNKNFSFAYRGLRSLGKYRNALASQGVLRLTYSYKSKNDKYQLRSHIATQEILNNEFGGLTANSVVNFESNDPNFRDRGRLETFFTDASNKLRSNRYYLEHDYLLIDKKDSLQSTFQLKIAHIFNYESKHYQFDQSAKNSFFGDAYTNSINDKNSFKKLYNQLSVDLTSKSILGSLQLFLDNYNYVYRYDNAVVLANNQLVSQSLHGNVSSVGASWRTKIQNISLKAKAATTFNGSLNGNYFKATASYKKDSLFEVKASLLNNSKAPNFNFLLYQSDYKSYNWQNTHFKNELTRSLLLDFTSEKLFNTSAQITQLDNYTYFDEAASGLQTKPMQFSGTINYVKIKVSKELKYKKFRLDNTIMYQQVVNGDSVFRVPKFITRNSIYYANDIFKKKPMYLQTGITFKYFTKYFANAYNPLLSEFSIQNDVEIGDYPVFDVFINARVRNMRLFLKGEHINSFFSPKKYYSAPNYPYRDFVIRFGVVWNFFI